MEKIACMECGKKFVRVCRHVRMMHGLSARDYKKLHGLDVKRGIISEEDRERMAAHVRRTGTIDNLASGARFRFVAGHSHNYERSAQTLARLRKLHTYKCNHEYIVRNDRTKKCKACGHVVNEGTRL